MSLRNRRFAIQIDRQDTVLLLVDTLIPRPTRKNIHMLQIIYLIAFTILAFLAIGNLIRSLIGFSMDAAQPKGITNPNFQGYSYRTGAVPHPELLDEMGNVTNEPLLIMKSISVEDARARLDALYHNDSPSQAEE